jgi:hypothetical protein
MEDKERLLEAPAKLKATPRKHDGEDIVCHALGKIYTPNGLTAQFYPVVGGSKSGLD